jgi:hypothetical protein
MKLVSIAAIAKALECSIEWLLYGREFAGDLADDPLRQRALAALLEVDPTMPTDVRDALASLRLNGDVPPLSKLRACYWALVG